MKNTYGKIGMTRNDKIFTAINYIFASLCLVLVAYPILYIVSASFSSPQAVMSGRVWLLPVEPGLQGYEAVFKDSRILTGYANSIFYAIFGTFINVSLTIMAGYPLSRKNFYGRSVIMILFTFTMLFSGGLIPTYLVVRQLGMLDTRWAMMIPNAMGVWNVIIARTFFKTTIPEELYEAAELDGCSDIKVFTKIVIPLSGAVIAVLSLFYAVGHWNSFMNALIYLRTPNLFPLQIILRQILILNQISAEMLGSDVEIAMRAQGLQDLVKYALIVVASAPLLILYPFIQKYFVKGIMIGSIKG